jgi:hypothetical protein
MATVVFDATIASFATSSAEVDLSKGWPIVKVVVPTMTSNTTWHVQVGDALSAAGGIYRRVVQHDPASASVSVDKQVLSSVTYRCIPFQEAAGAQYVKVETANIISFTAAFKVICSDGI